MKCKPQQMLYALLLMSLFGFSSVIHAEQVQVKLTVPVLDVATYHRPYVAVWLETTQRKGVHTLAIWYEQDDWLKDLRQWWRKLGRKGEAHYDASTGATRKPGRYQIEWDGRDRQGNRVAPGEYYLLVEAAREAGGRDFLRQKIRLGDDKTQRYTLQGDVELGEVTIIINARS